MPFAFDYPERARRRQRPAAAAARRRDPTGRPNARPYTPTPPSDRYRFDERPPTGQRAANPEGRALDETGQSHLDLLPTHDDGPPGILFDDFRRLRHEQARPRRARRLPLPRRPLTAAALLLPLLLLAAAAVVIGPVVYRGARAYQQVFVDSPPRPTPRFVAVRNDEGTAVIVTAPAEGEAAAPSPTRTPSPRPTATREPASTAAVAVERTVTPAPTATPKPKRKKPTPTPAPELPQWAGQERITILLLGVDRREDEPSRSDTMILVSIDPVAKQAAMLSVPRDLKVIIPGYGQHKINAAYAFGEADQLPGGGAGLVIRTIETNFGLRVDYFAQVDFDGFIKIVDTLGGVTVDVPYPIKDDAYPADGNNYMRVYFPAGWQHLDGERALQYSRTRHDDGDGNRSRRQQQILLALREQALDLGLVSRASELLAEVGDAVRTDLDPSRLLQLARLGSELGGGAIRTYSLDRALEEEQLPDQPYYLIADWDEVGRILSDFTGTEVTPPMSALANPRRDIRIRIDNRSGNPDLGQAFADVLKQERFKNVRVAGRDNAEPVDRSTITVDIEDLSTGVLIAGLLGLDLDAVEIRPAPEEPTATPTPSPTPTEPAVASPVAGTPGGAPLASPASSPAAASPPASPSTNPTAEPTTTPAVARSSAGIAIVIGSDARDPSLLTTEPIGEDPFLTPAAADEG